MRSYAVQFVRSARKELEGLDDATLVWRIRVGDFRVVYVVDDDAGVVEVRAVGNRKDTYT